MATEVITPPVEPEQLEVKSEEAEKPEENHVEEKQDDTANENKPEEAEANAAAEGEKQEERIKKTGSTLITIGIVIKPKLGLIWSF